MYIKAIAFNFTIEGAEAAPWLVLGYSLAANLNLWNPQADNVIAPRSDASIGH